MQGTILSVLGLSFLAFMASDPGCGSSGDDDDTTPSDTIEDCSDQTRDFWVWDFTDMPPKSVQLSATCRLMGPNSYLYVADDQWGTNVTQEMADAFMNTFEFQSSADALDPEQGIFDNDRAVFGDIPDALDDDPRMYVLLMDIKDYVSDDGTVYSFDGYFNAYDELPDAVVQAQTFGLYHSNEVEILYLNDRIRPVTDPYTLAVAAHELQHLIAYNYDTSEEAWMSESVAEVAMLVNGWFTDEPWVEDYAADPGFPLVTTGAGNYGAYLLWGMYLYEQLGQDFMMTLEEEQTDGMDGLNAALTSAGFSLTFNDLFADWVVANGIQDTTVEIGQYGYYFTDTLPQMASIAELTGTGGRYEGGVEAFGVDYIELDGLDAGLRLTVSSNAASSLLVQLVSQNSSATQLATWQPNANGSWTVDLQDGVDQHYLLIVTNTNTKQIDTGLTTDYSVRVE